MGWLAEHQWAVWLCLAAVLAVAEMVSLDFILIMLAGGALAGMLTSVVTDSIVIQVVVAAVVSVGLIGLLRPSLLQRLHAGPELVLGHRQLLGKQGLVTQEISPSNPGRISVAGEDWQARPYDDLTTIAAGETVDVLEIKGATAYVHPLPRLES